MQGLEGVLADQIIVTNVDDGFSLGDSGLDDLGDADHQVSTDPVNFDSFSLVNY